MKQLRKKQKKKKKEERARTVKKLRLLLPSPYTLPRPMFECEREQIQDIASVITQEKRVESFPSVLPVSSHYVHFLQIEGAAKPLLFYEKISLSFNTFLD